MLEKLVRYKHSNLIRKFLTYSSKKFYNIDTRWYLKFRGGKLKMRKQTGKVIKIRI
jgi:hypothetical protein